MKKRNSFGLKKQFTVLLIIIVLISVIDTLREAVISENEKVIKTEVKTVLTALEIMSTSMGGVENVNTEALTMALGSIRNLELFDSEYTHLLIFDNDYNVILDSVNPENTGLNCEEWKDAENKNYIQTFAENAGDIKEATGLTYLMQEEGELTPQTYIAVPAKDSTFGWNIVIIHLV